MSAQLSILSFDYNEKQFGKMKQTVVMFLLQVVCFTIGFTLAS